MDATWPVPGSPVGSEVGGYRIVAPLGSGGMGTVYRAVDGGGTPVALKLLHPHVGADPGSRDRLRREVAALQRLRHPGVAAVLDAEADSSEAFLVTELVEGSTLEQDVRENGPLPPEDLVALAEGLHDALAAVHAAGVLHRDLKPGNVMLTDEGPVLIDFGIAQAADDVRVTSTGFVVGTPGYLAPELLADADPGPASDWWGWAAVLAFAATGRPPFGSRPLEAVLARTRAGDVDLIGVDRATATALQGALDPDPRRRTPPDDVVAQLARAAAAAAERAELPTEMLTVALPPRPDDATEPVTRALHRDTGTRVLPAVPLGGAPGAPAAPVRAGATAAFGVPGDAGQPYPGDDVAPDAATGRDGGDDGSAGPWDPGPDAGAGSGATAYAPPRPRRRMGTVLALGVLAVAAGTLYPGATLLAVAVGLLLLRTVGSAAQAVQRRRERRGAVGRGDVLGVMVASPWHLLRALVGLLPSLIVAASVVTVVGGLLWWALGTGRLALPAWGPILGVDPGAAGDDPAGTPAASVVLGIAVLLGVVAVWWGPLSRLTREGARWTLNAVAPGWSGAVVLVALALAATAVLVVLAATGQPVTWWPLPGPPDVR